MALREIHEFTLSSLVPAAAYGSATHNAYFDFPPYAEKYAAKVGCGSVVGNLKVDWTLSHAHEDQNVATPSWQNLLTGKCMSYTNQIEVEFESVSQRPLLPYGRLQMVCKSLDSDVPTVSDLVGYIMSEFK